MKGLCVACKEEKECTWLIVDKKANLVCTSCAENISQQEVPPKPKNLEELQRYIKILYTGTKALGNTDEECVHKTIKGIMELLHEE